MADVPPSENGESPLERVRRRLYSSATTPGASEHAEQPHTAPASAPTRNWKPEVAPKKGLSATAWFFIAAFVFFLGAGIIAGLILFLGGRSVGNDRMSITFEGPISLDGGEETSFDIIVENGNPVEAGEIALSINFPQEAFDPETMEPLGHYDASLEALTPGEFVRHPVRVVFFGAEDQEVVIPVKIEYRTPNSSAVFVKEETRTITIAQAPLSLRITALPELSSGQEITVKASVRSNAKEPLSNVALEAQYPFGFIPTATEPASIGADVFALGTLSPGEEQEVSITGVLTGEDGDERVFRFEAGILPSEEATALQTPSFTIAVAPVTISKSFLAVDVSLNQEEGDIVAAAGEGIEGLVTWINSVTSTIADAQIKIAFSGEAFDADSVGVGSGYYRSSDRTIVFDRTTEQGLSSLSPGETGAGAFRFSVRDSDALRLTRGPSASLTISVSGRKVDEGGREDVLQSTLVRTVKVQSALTLDAYATHSTGPFENSGPIPPVADTETTYTVIWKVSNTVNTVANVNVKAMLPSYVRFVGLTDPSTGISFNDFSQEVVWNVGEVAPGTTREGAFQIALTPSASQQGVAPIIVSNQQVAGFDRFVQKTVGGEVENLTTELRDPGFVAGDGRVK